MSQNNINILPWYTSLAYQNHRRKANTMGIYPLFAQQMLIPPFQFRVDSNYVEGNQGDTTIYAELVSYNNEHAPVVITSFFTSTCTLVDMTDYKLIVNNGTLAYGNPPPKLGQYYVHVRVTTQTEQGPLDTDVYSEIFTYTASVASLLKVSFWHSEPFATTGDMFIHYDAETFKNFFYIDAMLVKPDYPIEEVSVDRDGYKYMEWQISKKVFKFEFIAPEYLCDVLRLIRLHDYVEVYDGITGNTLACDTILFTPKWQQSSELAVVETEIECDTVVKSVAKKSQATRSHFNSSFHNQMYW